MQQDPFQIKSRTVSFHLCGKLFWSGNQVSWGCQESPSLSTAPPTHFLLTGKQELPRPSSPTQKPSEGLNGYHAKAGSSPGQNLLFLLVCGAQQNHFHQQERGWALGQPGSIREQENKQIQGTPRDSCLRQGYVETLKCSAVRSRRYLQEATVAPGL